MSLKEAVEMCTIGAVMNILIYYCYLLRLLGNMNILEITSKHGEETSMGTSAFVAPKGIEEPAPRWIHLALSSNCCILDTFGAMSSGMQLLGDNTVSRLRLSNSVCDAAQWKRGFKTGKHIFEIAFPVSQRGTHSSVGVGYKDAPLSYNSRVCLVGNNRISWGISLKRKESCHNKKRWRYPQYLEQLPDRFYMYLDADNGILHFGSDHGYFGVAHSFIDMCQPVYPLVASNKHGACVTMVYRGKGAVRTGPLKEYWKRKR